MAKYVTTGIPQKTVGAYLKVVKALNELEDLGEDVQALGYGTLDGISHSIRWDGETWRLDGQA